MKKIWLFSTLILFALYLTQCSPKTAKKIQTDKPLPPANSSIPPSDADMQMQPSFGTLAPSDVIVHEDGTESPAPLMEVEETTGIDVGHGKQIWASSCRKCHELYAPASRTAEQWEQILEVMADKAQLSPDDRLGVTAYLRTHAKK